MFFSANLVHSLFSLFLNSSHYQILYTNKNVKVRRWFFAPSMTVEGRPRQGIKVEKCENSSRPLYFSAACYTSWAGSPGKSRGTQAKTVSTMLLWKLNLITDKVYNKFRVDTVPSTICLLRPPFRPSLIPLLFGPPTIIPAVRSQFQGTGLLMVRVTFCVCMFSTRVLFDHDVF